MTDDRLIAGLLNGDEDCFRALFRQHGPTMYAVSLRMLAHNAADAEDAVQEAWLRGVRGLPAFRGESSLGTWLVGIAIRCAHEICRRRRLPVEVDLEQLAAPVTPGHDHLDVERAIAALPDGYRHVVVLHDIHGYTHAEIGALLQIDEGTSKSQLSRARRALRRWLGVAPTTREQMR